MSGFLSPPTDTHAAPETVKVMSEAPPSERNATGRMALERKEAPTRTTVTTVNPRDMLRARVDTLTVEARS